MNSKIDSIFVCLVISLIFVFSIGHTNADVELLDDLVYYDDSEINELSFKDRSYLHHAFVIEESKWNGGQIDFKIDKNFDADEISKILVALYEIERSSCIRFAAHDPSNGFNYVMIQKDYANSGVSSSSVGCLHQGEQLLSLSVDMVNEHQTILHELLHTIGFNHQHQRSDRDNYIDFHFENTNLSESAIFTEFAAMVGVDPRITYLTPFDFNSVMLYDEHSYSINHQPVMTSKIKGANVPTYQDRNRGLSTYDIILLNEFYDCNTVDKKRSKNFYEDRIGIVDQPVVNFHEIQRAKNYWANELQNVAEKDELDEQWEYVSEIEAADDEFAQYDNEEDYDDNNEEDYDDIERDEINRLMMNVINNIKKKSQMEV